MGHGSIEGGHEKSNCRHESVLRQTKRTVEESYGSVPAFSAACQGRGQKRRRTSEIEL